MQWTVCLGGLSHSLEKRCTSFWSSFRAYKIKKKKKRKRKRTGLINHSQYLPVISSFPSFNRVVAVFCVRWEMLLNPFPQRKISILETGFHVGAGCIDAFIHNYLGDSTSYRCPVVLL